MINSMNAAHGLLIEALVRSREVLMEQHKNCGGEDTIYSEPLQIIDTAFRSFVNTRLGCFVDALNPCWDHRPTDVVGKHWAGGPACAYCHASALIAEQEDAHDWDSQMLRAEKRMGC